MVESVEMTQREKQLEALQQATIDLMEASTRDEVADIGVEAARDILHLEANAIHLVNEDETGLVGIAQTDAGHELIGDAPTLPKGDSIAWRVYEDGQARAIDDVRADPDVYNPETPVRGEIFLPLDDHGVLLATSRKPRAFDERDVTLGEILAANVTVALDQVEREQRLRNRKRELTRQNERLEKFASIVSHDLRNPLSTATGRLELARKECESSHLEDVERAHQRMAELIDTLLSLARAGKDIDEMDTVSLPLLAETCWQRIDSKNATLVVETDQRITADRSRLQQLLENLFRNAVEHGSTSPRSQTPGVTVTIGDLTTRDGFYVADDGPGIDEDIESELFESGGARENGIGFGLSIVHDIVMAHGWDVTVTKSETGGARFEIDGVS